MERIPPVPRPETFSHKGFRVPDPFAPRQRPGASFVNALLATALFRCWHILLFSAAWSTLITILNNQGHKLFFQPTLLTVIGTVIGFIISYRTSSSFERYNEGRMLWSHIISASRTLARTIWFHIPDVAPAPGQSVDDANARALIEKKSAINLIEAFSVAIKHYLRGEDGIYYQDLYYLVKFLPAYALPAGLPNFREPLVEVEDPPDIPVTPTHPTTSPQFPQNGGLTKPASPGKQPSTIQSEGFTSPTSPGKQPSITYAGDTSFLRHRDALTSPHSSLLPAPVSSKSPGKRSPLLSVITSPLFATKEKERTILPRDEEADLLPAHMPPKYGVFDLFPFHLLVKFLTKRGKSVKGKKGAVVRAKLRSHAISHNLPLELSLYLSSYIAAVQKRKGCDDPTRSLLLGSLGQLVDSLTGLERILTTPIPFSYSFHLWVVTAIYCFALPFQIWPTLKWMTIPATIVSSLIFFVFLVAGEEIENPFGYDENDLNLDHFTQNIIRNELRAVTSTPPPDPSRWAFVPENNLLFSISDRLDDRVTPEEWLSRGYAAMQKNLSFD